MHVCVCMHVCVSTGASEALCCRCSRLCVHEGGPAYACAYLHFHRDEHESVVRVRALGLRGCFHHILEALISKILIHSICLSDICSLFMKAGNHREAAYIHIYVYDIYIHIIYIWFYIIYYIVI